MGNNLWNDTVILIPLNEDGTAASVIAEQTEKSASAVPASTYSLFTSRCGEMGAVINAAKKGTSVVLNLKEFNALNPALASMMQTRSDLTYHINYTYQDKAYTVTVPANADWKSVKKSEDGCIGLRQVDSVFKGSEGTYTE